MFAGRVATMANKCRLCGRQDFEGSPRADTLVAEFIRPHYISSDNTNTLEPSESNTVACIEVL
jgi:hypothetical protein